MTSHPFSDDVLALKSDNTKRVPIKHKDDKIKKISTFSSQNAENAPAKVLFFDEFSLNNISKLF